MRVSVFDGSIRLALGTVHGNIGDFFTLSVYHYYSGVPVIGGLYILSGKFPILEVILEGNREFFIELATKCGIFSGAIVGFACIQHLTLRFILYRANYIPWNYTHFLEYTTERIFLQKVGEGYIFVHRLLLEHFAALYQPSQLSLNTRLNLLRTRKRQVFSLSLIGTAILISFLGCQFREEYVQKFIEYLGNPNRRIDYYSSEIQKDPKNHENYIMRGKLYHDQKQYDRAIADYSEVIKLDPKSIYAYKHRGDAYYSKEDYDRAVADFTQSIKLDPKYPYPYNSRGDAYYSKKDYDRAVADYSEAIKLDPNFAKAYYKRGLAYKNQGSKDKAVEDFRKVLELSKDRDLSKKASKKLQELSTLVP